MIRCFLVAIISIYLVSCSIDPVRVGTVPIRLEAEPVSLNVSHEVLLDSPGCKIRNPQTKKITSCNNEPFSKAEIFRVLNDVVTQTFAPTNNGSPKFDLRVFVSQENEASIRGTSLDYVGWKLLARYEFVNEKGVVIEKAISSGASEERGFLSIDRNRPYNLTLRALNELALRFAADVRKSGLELKNSNNN